MSTLSRNAFRGDALAAAAPVPSASDIDTALDTLEAPLAAVAHALRSRDPALLAQQANALQAALSAALPRLRDPRRGTVLPAARPRLAAARALLAAERDCIAREHAACDRGLALLMPAPQPTAVYGTTGQADRPATRGSLCA